MTSLMTRKCRRTLFAAGFLITCCLGLAALDNPLYLDSTQPAGKRIEDLLGRMTLEEKVGQMNMPCVYLDPLGKTVEQKIDACRRFTAGTFADGIGPGGGFFTLANNILPGGPRQQAEYFNELQRIAIEKTRLRIPLLQTEEGTHGVMCSGATIFPEGLALGSTWNTDLLEKIYAVDAREARAVGIHQLFTLVIEPVRDPRLGRNEEALTEDPYLSSRIAEVIVRGIQGNGISAPDKAVAGLCHYPGQSQPASGLERGAMDISERTLRNVFLPPWMAGIHKAGALGVMATYPAIAGIPTHTSAEILTKILRDELGFQGLVLSEGGGVSSLVYEHVAANQKEAGIQAIHAGVDVGISYESGYMQDLVESVREGRVPMALIDRAVRRILEMKFRLGLFERPYVDVEHAVNGLPRAEHRQLALQAAREGTVLLKNEKDLLPLRKNLRSIAIIGPNADDERNQLGDYTSITIPQNIVTVLEGVKAKVSPQTRVTYVKGCGIMGTALNEIARAKEAAQKADAAIVVVGESEEQGEDRGTNGEGRDVASLDLTGMQEDLIKAVQETGTPTIVVLINGRPLTTRWAAEHVPAILEAWHPGEQGGNAIADILFGDYSPSGRLAITIPRHVGQLPVYYNYAPSKEYWKRRGYVDMPVSPLYEFGYGLSYSTFEYSGLRISPKEVPAGGSARVSFRVTNTGKRAAAEVAQLYIRDVVASVSRPVKELKGFRKVDLKPGETATVELELTPEDLSMLNRDMRSIVEPGRFDIMVGSSSENIHLRGSFSQL